MTVRTYSNAAVRRYDPNIGTPAVDAGVHTFRLRPVAVAAIILFYLQARDVAAETAIYGTCFNVRSEIRGNRQIDAAVGRLKIEARPLPAGTDQCDADAAVRRAALHVARNIGNTYTA